MTHRVVVVEDNPITRKMMVVALQASGYDVLGTGDGRGALDLVAREKPDLVAQDLILPDMDGIELARRIRKLPEGRDVALVAVSGLASKLEEARGVSPGFAQVLFKPIEPSRLVEVIGNLLPRGGSATSTQGGDRSILLVDDDPIQRKLQRLRLEDQGFRVRTAGSALDALDEARRSPPDAIVSDLLMPGMDGLDFCRVVRQDPVLAHVPFVLTSASCSSVEDTDQRMAHSAGVSAFVPRTPTLDGVIDALLAAFRGRPHAVVTPSTDVAALKSAYTTRITDQLERQAELNQTLMREAAAKTAQLSILTAVADVLSEDRSLDAILQEVLARTLDAAGVSIGAIYLTDTGSRTRLACHLGYPASVAHQLGDFFGHAEFLEEVLSTGRPMTTPVARPGDDGTRVPGNGSAPAGCTLLPLVAGGKRLGVLMIASAYRHLGPDWVDIAMAVGVQIAQAVALAQSVDRLRKVALAWEAAARDREMALERERIARAEAEAANTSKSQFLAVMSHELRTPLNAVIGYVDLMELGVHGPLTTKQHDDLRRIRRNGQHLLVLITDILEYTHAEVGRGELRVADVSVQEVLERVDALIAPQLHAKGLAFSIEQGHAPLVVHADPAKLTQVLTNLLENARKFTPSGGRISVLCEAEEETVTIRIADTGAGIAAEHVDRIFEPFFQVDRSHTRVHGGIGMGLAISRAWARAMGGDISVISTLGRGTAFTVALRRARIQPPDAVAHQDA